MTNLWRKQILRFGTIEYDNVKLSFTSESLTEIQEAFIDKAFEIVPLMSLPKDHEFSYDPELLRGVVNFVEVVDDGMDAIIEVGDKLDQILTIRPKTPVATRLFKDYYLVTRKKKYPFVLAGVYLTNSPIMTDLRDWVREPDPTYGKLASDIREEINRITES